MQYPHVKACLFDLDGLLVDTERMYTKIYQTLLQPYGKEFTMELKSKLMGMPVLDAANYTIKTLDLPLKGEEWVRKMDEVSDALFRTVPLLDGAQRLIQHLHKHKIPIAIATGSRMKNFIIKTSHLPHVFSLFPEDVIITGDHPQLKKGKPDPQIFQIAADSLKLKPEECLVFEDGVPGVQAANAGNFPVIWVPEEFVYNIVKDDATLKPTQKLNSLAEFRPEQFGLPPFDV